MKKLPKFLTLLIAALALHSCFLLEPTPLKTQIANKWALEKEERSNGQVYYDNGVTILTFHSSGKLSMPMSDGSTWYFATWTVDEDKKMLYIRDNANSQPTVWSGDFQVLSISSSKLVISTKYSYESYTTTYTFTKYTENQNNTQTGAPSHSGLSH